MDYQGELIRNLHNFCLAEFGAGGTVAHWDWRISVGPKEVEAWIYPPEEDCVIERFDPAAYRESSQDPIRRRTMVRTRLRNAIAKLLSVPPTLPISDFLLELKDGDVTTTDLSKPENAMKVVFRHGQARGNQAGRVPFDEVVQIGRVALNSYGLPKWAESSVRYAMAIGSEELSNRGILTGENVTEYLRSALSWGGTDLDLHASARENFLRDCRRMQCALPLHSGSKIRRIVGAFSAGYADVWGIPRGTSWIALGAIVAAVHGVCADNEVLRAFDSATAEVRP